jgi:hypothetical protein
MESPYVAPLNHRSLAISLSQSPGDVFLCARHRVGEACHRAKPPVACQRREVRAGKEQRRGIGTAGAPTEPNVAVVRLDPAA